MTKAASFSSLTAVFDFWMAKSEEKYDKRVRLLLSTHLGFVVQGFTGHYNTMDLDSASECWENLGSMRCLVIAIYLS